MNPMEWFESLPTAGKWGVGLGAAALILYIWKPWAKSSGTNVTAQVAPDPNAGITYGDPYGGGTSGGTNYTGSQIGGGGIDSTGGGTGGNPAGGISVSTPVNSQPTTGTTTTSGQVTGIIGSPAPQPVITRTPTSVSQSAPTSTQQAYQQLQQEQSSPYSSQMMFPAGGDTEPMNPAQLAQFNKLTIPISAGGITTQQYNQDASQNPGWIKVDNSNYQSVLPGGFSQIVQQKDGSYIETANNGSVRSITAAQAQQLLPLMKAN